MFDIDLLSRRLVKATEWLQHEPAGAGLPVSYFGASTGAAAALAAAAVRPEEFVAPAAAGPTSPCSVLGDVQAPTLLIVGSRDEVVLEPQPPGAAPAQCESRLAVVPGATTSEEPGTPAQAARLAWDWLRHRAPSGTMTA